jgi:F-type H+-transporting ATPase subunit a
MITNLFSVFDPSSSLRIPINWVRALIFILVVIPTFWVTPTKAATGLNAMSEKLHYEFKTLLGNTSFQGRTLPFIALFIFILINNFIGLFPYIFTASRHIILTLTLRIPLWLTFIIFGWINQTKHIFAHLVPQSTPGALMPFIVLIESIRNVIRPITLAVRLIANIVAGHLLITLLGNQTASASGIILAGLLATQIILLTLESAVAVIQSYVFAVLSTLYAREVTSH